MWWMPGAGQLHLCPQDFQTPSKSIFSHSADIELLPDAGNSRRASFILTWSQAVPELPAVMNATTCAPKLFPET